MSIRIRPYDEDSFIIEGDLSGKDGQLRTLGAHIGRDENGLLVWMAPHQCRAKFERYMELGQLYLDWRPSMVLEIAPILTLSFICDALTRIGKYQSYFGDRVFYRAFHLYEKNGRFYFLHHLEILELKGIRTAMTFMDLDLRDSMANMLQEWGYFQIVDKSKRMRVTAQMIRELTLITPEEREANFWCTVYDSL